MYRTKLKRQSRPISKRNFPSVRAIDPFEGAQVEEKRRWGNRRPQISRQNPLNTHWLRALYVQLRSTVVRPENLASHHPNGKNEGKKTAVPKEQSRDFSNETLRYPISRSYVTKQQAVEAQSLFVVIKYQTPHLTPGRDTYIITCLRDTNFGWV